MATADQDDWVFRVLGVRRKPEASARPREKLLPLWVEAKEKADEGIAKLQDALREQEDDDLDTIAEFGLYGATTGEGVALMVALREADSKGTIGAYAKAAEAADEFRDFLESAPIVDLIESNPFGVTAPLRAFLLPALTEIVRLAG